MNCLKCEKEILETMVCENGSGWMKLGEGKKVMHNGENEYVPCPYCGAKNILSNVPPGIKGAMRFKFTRYED